MKQLSKLILCLLLALSMMTGALAAEVPDSLVTENLNGQQRLVKTYTLSPDVDPDTLQEENFTYDGFLYSWAYTTKEEHPYCETKTVTETVTVEIASNDLTEILAELAPSISYNQDGYTGELTLDHTTLVTEAAGYATKYSTVTETKVIGNLDRNDMSYVPATTVKNGRTLSLSNVEWQVTGTALMGGALVPAQYQAVATYSASSSYQVATGYVTTAEYHGEVMSEGIKDVTYTVVYTGSEIIPAKETGSSGAIQGIGAAAWLVCGLLLVLGLLALGRFLFLQRKNVYVYVPGSNPREYKLVAKFRVKPAEPSIDLRELNPIPTGTVAVEVKRTLAKHLCGKDFIIHCPSGDHTYTIQSDRRNDWHEFELDTEQPEVLT